MSEVQVRMCSVCGGDADEIKHGAYTHAHLGAAAEGALLCGATGRLAVAVVPSEVLTMIRAVTDALLRDLRNHADTEGAPVEVRGTQGWSDVLPVVEALSQLVTFPIPSLAREDPPVDGG